jgi:hypothetical protein
MLDRQARCLQAFYEDLRMDALKAPATNPKIFAPQAGAERVPQLITKGGDKDEWNSWEELSGKIQRMHDQGKGQQFFFVGY